MVRAFYNEECFTGCQLLLATKNYLKLVAKRTKKTSMNQKYTATIGLEIHAQLNTKRKMFAPEAVVYGALPNTFVSAVTLALPGTLPKVNRESIRKAVMMGIACKSIIANEISFYRKNYFYPDLPKGYQITQGEVAICTDGEVVVSLANGEEKSIYLERIHLEEDTGKSIHNDITDETSLDFNRAGSPLIEIVTKPCMTTSEEAYSFLTEVRKLVRYLDICDGNMEEGSLRCDVNISIMPVGSEVYGQRVEIKNLNSIRSVQMSIDYEIDRHISLIESGQKINFETRSYDADTNTTTCLRSKNTASDYRYFPEPNLPPIFLSDETISSIRNNMPLLPRECFNKFTKEYALSFYDAQVLTSTKEIALFFNEVCKLQSNYKAVANWISGPVRGYLNDLNISISEFPISVVHMAELIDLVQKDLVSFTVASQRIFSELLKGSNLSPKEIAKSLKLLQNVDKDELLSLVKNVLAQHPDKVEAYKNGKTGVIDMLMGQVMRQSGGTVSPKIAKDLLSKLLEK